MKLEELFDFKPEGGLSLTHGSLFSGIGGFDLAAEWMGWKNIFHCEWNPFGQKILKHYWPNSISYADITKTDFTIHRGDAAFALVPPTGRFCSYIVLSVVSAGAWGNEGIRPPAPFIFKQRHYR